MIDFDYNHQLIFCSFGLKLINKDFSGSLCCCCYCIIVVFAVILIIGLLVGGGDEGKDINYILDLYHFHM